MSQHLSIWPNRRRSGETPQGERYAARSGNAPTHLQLTASVLLKCCGGKLQDDAREARPLPVLIRRVVLRDAHELLLAFRFSHPGSPTIAKRMLSHPVSRSHVGACARSWCTTACSSGPWWLVCLSSQCLEKKKRLNATLSPEKTPHRYPDDSERVAGHHVQNAVAVGSTQDAEETAGARDTGAQHTGEEIG